jgi:hypothetical protein
MHKEQLRAYELHQTPPLDPQQSTIAINLSQQPITPLEPPHAKPDEQSAKVVGTPKAARRIRNSIFKALQRDQ